MKKAMVLFVVMALVACAAAAVAEGIDLSGLTDDEIVTLMDRVREEMVARHIEGTATLASGTYIAGRDIPAGSYVFTCMATGDDWGNVTIYSESGKGRQLFWEVVSAPEEDEEPESFFITLEQDDQLKSGVPFSLTIYGGVVFK